MKLNYFITYLPVGYTTLRVLAGAICSSMIVILCRVSCSKVPIMKAHEESSNFGRANSYVGKAQIMIPEVTENDMCGCLKILLRVGWVMRQ
jgi:hypothetical protein